MNKTLSHKTARFISTLFVPPSFTIIVFVYFAISLESDVINKIIVAGNALLWGFIVPIALFVILKRNGKLADMDASIKEERTFPFILSTVFYTAGLLILVLINANIISTAFWFCYISNTILVILINKYWKISIHAIGSSGPVAALTFVLGPAALVGLVIPSVVGWSRVKLKCHDVYQVTAGASMGFLSTYLQMYLIIKFFA